MIILVDKHSRENLFPFTYLRHTADILIGILTIREKWEMLLQEKVSTNENDIGIHVPASIIPTTENYIQIIDAAKNNISFTETNTIKIISFPWHIFQLNEYALLHDFALLTKNKISAGVNETNKTILPENIYIAKGTTINHSILNASKGPIYIDEGAEIMEGVMIKGPFYLGKNSVVKMGATIYGATTIGPNCIVGGEIKNSVLFANSNKAHHGYLGDSVVGEWCNFGAGTSNSNLKNSGGNVGYILEKDTQAIFAGNKAGLLMGDFSRAAINTSFNTGTVVGVCCNIFGEIMPPKFLDNFTWGKEKYIFEKAIVDIENWMHFKQQKIDTCLIEKLKLMYTNT